METANCKVCCVLQVRYWNGARRGVANQKIYVNEVGRQWNGLTCYSCDRARAALAQKMSRLAGAPEHNPELLGPERSSTQLNPLTHRRCRDCNARLRKSHYFRCVDCTAAIGSNAPYSMEDWGYSNTLYTGHTSTRGAT